MKKTKAYNIQNISIYSVAIVAFVATQLLFYQFYYSVPITVNNQSFVAKRGEPLVEFLKKKNKLPTYGRLLDVSGKIIPGQKGNPPVVIVNEKHSDLEYPIEGNEVIKTIPGTDKTESTAEKVEEYQSKLKYRGKGAFIYLIRKGRPGVRMVKRGLLSGKIVRSKWIITPQSFTIGKTNIRHRRVVALTFDDGPSKYTSLIMKILKENKAKASFFVTGRNVKKRAKLLKTMARRHYTIGNHTYNHVALNKSKTKVIEKEIKATDKAIFEASGIKPKWVRPPGGALNSSAINFLVNKDYRISMWNIDTSDWRRSKPATIKNKILENLKPGQVILMHDGGGNRLNTAAALTGIIREIKKAGYRLVTLDELYRLIE